MSFRPRVIPMLQLSGKGLVKTLGFKDPVYIGDPINTVKIFNDFRADELMLADIEASRKNQPIQFDLIRRIAEEAYMPLSYGGGVKTIEDAARLIQSGVEKIILGTALHTNPALISEIASRFGSQAILACIDLKKHGDQYAVWYKSATLSSTENVFELMDQVIQAGAGELLIQFIDTDGYGKGVDHTWVKQFSDHSSVPLIVAGGISSLQEMKELTTAAGASAAAAGSLFSFLGGRNAVLINYPDEDELKETFE